MLPRRIRLIQISKLFPGIHRRLYGSTPAIVPDRRYFNFMSWRLLVSLIVLLIPLAAICLAKSSIQDNPHHFQQTCEHCHNLVAKTSSSRNETIGPLHRDINQGCSQAGCHNYDPRLSHPVGIKAGDRIPHEMPLNDTGQITCLTCHDELNGSSSNHLPAFLRRAPGGDLCSSCHQGPGNTRMKRSHWQFTTKAHLGIDKEQTSSEDAFEASVHIDPESFTCLSCHDNISAVMLGENESTFERMRRQNSMSDHPMGMNYASKAYLNNREFNLPFSIDPRIRFFNGRVGCGSCHNLYNSEKNNLAVPSAGSNLCRQCHIK